MIYSIISHLKTIIAINIPCYSCRLLTPSGQHLLTCRVIHSLTLVMSAVQIFLGDKLVGVAHLIGAEQLPNITQVSQAT